MAGAGLPLAEVLKQTFPPSQTVESFGFIVTAGPKFTVNLPAAEFTEPHVFVNTAR